MEQIKYDFNVREEVFGATILNLNTGERQYITTEELKLLLEKNKFPSDIYKGYNNIEFKIKFTPLKNKVNYFSFADISYVEVTRACNLRCLHCLNNSGTKLENQLSYEELKNLILKYSENRSALWNILILYCKTITVLRSFLPSGRLCFV